MALKNLFKRKEPVTEGSPEPSVETKTTAKMELPKEKLAPVLEDKKEAKAGKPAAKPKTARKSSPEAYKTLVGIHVTEKATDLTGQNQYVFKVFKNANKIQIRKAIENVFGVSVLNVNIVNIPRKKKRWGRTEGFKKGYKKAIVKLKPGEKIDIMPG